MPGEGREGTVMLTRSFPVQVKINTFLTTKVEVEMLPLRGDGRPPGLLKAIRHRYGDDLDCLRQDAALRHIHVDYRRLESSSHPPPSDNSHTAHSDGEGEGGARARAQPTMTVVSGQT